MCNVDEECNFGLIFAVLHSEGSILLSINHFLIQK